MDKKLELKLALKKEILSNAYDNLGEFREIDLPIIETYAGHPFWGSPAWGCFPNPFCPGGYGSGPTISCFVNPSFTAFTSTYCLS